MVRTKPPTRWSLSFFGLLAKIKCSICSLKFDHFKTTFCCHRSLRFLPMGCELELALTALRCVSSIALLEETQHQHNYLKRRTMTEDGLFFSWGTRAWCLILAPCRGLCRTRVCSALRRSYYGRKADVPETKRNSSGNDSTSPSSTYPCSTHEVSRLCSERGMRARLPSLLLGALAPGSPGTGRAVLSCASQVGTAGDAYWPDDDFRCGLSH